MKYHYLFLTALCALFPVLAHADDNLFPEGNFEILAANGLPEGFVLPDKNDKPWQAGSVLTVESENGDAFGRIKTTEAFPSFYALFINLPVPAGKSQGRISARIRSEVQDRAADATWHGLRFHVAFAEEQGEGRNWTVTGDKRVDALSIENTTDVWVEKEGTFQIPEGAKFICARVQIGGLVGTFDLDDIVITAD